MPTFSWVYLLILFIPKKATILRLFAKLSIKIVNLKVEIDRDYPLLPKKRDNALEVINYFLYPSSLHYLSGLGYLFLIIEFQGSFDFFALNYYTTMMATPATTYEYAFDRDLNVQTEINDDWKPSNTAWLKVNSSHVDGI